MALFSPSIWLPSFCVHCGEVTIFKSIFCHFCQLKLDQSLSYYELQAQGTICRSLISWSGPMETLFRSLTHHTKGAGDLYFRKQILEKGLCTSAWNEFLREKKTIVPVPSRSGGVDHAEEWAQALGQLSGWAIKKSLCRLDQQKQSLQNKKNRRKVQIERVSNLEIHKNEIILLVDDVITTGGTISACAHALEGQRVEGFGVGFRPLLGDQGKS